MHFNFSQISKEDLLACNQKGWIPGPEESEKDFLHRIEILHHFMTYPPQEIDQFFTDTDWVEVHERLKECYDICPDWIIGYYSNQNLSFFQGAATWIVEKDHTRIPLIQLREKFSSGSLWKIYRKDEVVAHEVVHAVRMQFDEPWFEEFFAYKTSSNVLRRTLGPLFQKPWESTLLIFLLWFPLIAITLQGFFGGNIWWNIIASIPVFYLGILFIRFLCLRLVLSLALFRLHSFLKEPKKIWAAALRLKDSEIFRCAFVKKSKLLHFFEMQKSLRWKFIRQEYLK